MRNFLIAAIVGLLLSGCATGKDLFGVDAQIVHGKSTGSAITETDFDNMDTMNAELYGYWEDIHAIVGPVFSVGDGTYTDLSDLSSTELLLLNGKTGALYEADGTDVAVADGGTGTSSLTDGGVLLGSGTGAVTPMAVLADGEMIVGDGTTDPVAESGATLRTSIGVGTGDSPQFTGIELGHATENTLSASSGVLSVEGDEVLQTDELSQIDGMDADTNPDDADLLVLENAVTGAKTKLKIEDLPGADATDFAYASLAALEAVDGDDISNGDLALVGTTDQKYYVYIADSDGVAVWDSGTTYDAGDYAYNDSVGYICILESTNNEPPNATYWMVATPKFLIPDTNTGTISWELQLWIEDGAVQFNSIAAAAGGVTDPTDGDLTADQMNHYIVMTSAGDVYIPADSCDTATFQWVCVTSNAAHANSIGSYDASDLFMLSSGTKTGAGDEIDLAGAAGSQVCVMCVEANTWKVTGEIGTCTDGGEN